jgi:hypothetical protein
LGTRLSVEGIRWQRPEKWLGERNDTAPVKDGLVTGMLRQRRLQNIVRIEDRDLWPTTKGFRGVE